MLDQFEAGWIATVEIDTHAAFLSWKLIFMYVQYAYQFFSTLHARF